MKNQKEFILKSDAIKSYLALGYQGSDVWRMLCANPSEKHLSYNQFMKLIKKHDLNPWSDSKTNVLQEDAYGN